MPQSLSAESPPAESLSIVRSRIGERIAEIQRRVSGMKPADISARMDAIRLLAAEHGLAAVEGLASYSAHHAMLPGHRQATRSVLEHMTAAIDSSSERDRETILAAMAVRLH